MEWEKSGHEIYAYIITDSANAFVRVSLSCWSVVILGGWGRIGVTVELGGVGGFPIVIGEVEDSFCLLGLVSA